MGWIITLGQIRTPFLDQFFSLMNLLDTKGFVFLVISIIWIGYHWRWGLRVGLIMMTSSIVNYSLKAIFQEPRPLQIDPSVGLIDVTGYSFPSGAAQSAVILTGLSLIYIKSRWKWLIAATYFPILSFSRVYISAHYVSDILGGWLVGAILLILFRYLYIPLEKRLEKKAPLYLIGFCEIIGLIFYKTLYGAVIMSMGVGLVITYYAGVFLPPAKNVGAFIKRSLVGVAGVIPCLFLLTVSPFWASILATLWVSCGSQFVLKPLK